MALAVPRRRQPTTPLLLLLALRVVLLAVEHAHAWTPLSTGNSKIGQQHEHQEHQEQEKPNPAFTSWDRRAFFTTTGLLLPSPAWAAASGNSMVDVGRGVDVSIDTSGARLSDPNNLVFPGSFAGRYACQRTIMSIEGDVYQAQSAWRGLGANPGHAVFAVGQAPEVYETQLIPIHDGTSNYAVVDRQFEWTSRSTSSSSSSAAASPTLSSSSVQWNPQTPNTAQIGSTISWAIIQRSVILPNLDQGMVAGGQELVRIRDGTGPLVATTRAVQIKTRVRPAPPGAPHDLEGLELVKTYRVLDGIAGTEFPTSTTKSLLKWKRLGPVVTTSKEDAATLVSSSSTLYFDGSNWY